MGQWTAFHAGALLLTFLSYALYHMVRKTPSYVQSSLLSEWTPGPPSPALNSATSTSSPGPLFPSQQSAEAFMGILNATFLFVYAAGNVLSGMLADRLDLRLLLTLGMTLSAVVMFVFGPVLEWTGGGSQAAYLVLQTLNALCQATGWPCLVPVMANWFSRESRGYLLGLWSSSPSVGSVVGALILSGVVGYGYEYAFVVTSGLLFAGGVLIFFGLVTSPLEVGLARPGDQYLLLSSDDSVQNRVDEDSGGHSSSPPSFDGERRTLLERKQDWKKGYMSHAPVSHRDSTDPCCSAKFAANDCTPTGVTSTVRYQDERTKLSPSLPRPSHAQQVEAQTVHAAGEDTKATHADVEPENRLRSAEKKQCDTNHRRASDAASRLHHDITSRQTLHSDTNSASPVNEKLADPDQSVPDTLTSNAEQSWQAEAGDNNHHKAPKAISICQAFLLPGVIPFSLCFCFLKLVIYVFYFWLPFYLSSSYGWSESAADRMALWYDVGGVAGAVVSAFLMAKLNKSALIMAPMIVISIPVMFLYGILGLGKDPAVNAALLLCLGGLLAGVGNLLSAAVSEDLSQQEALQESTRAMSTVTGILEGCGTVGAALGQIVVPYLNAALGWDSMFYFLMACTLLSALSVSPIVVSEVKDALRKRGKP